jgi:hypothetical protein
MHRFLTRGLTVAGAAAIGLLAFAAPLSAATTFTTPTESPFAVPANGSGKPMAFTVEVGGFEPNTSVFIEQCDGKAATSADWTPVKHCDVLTSPAAAITDANGVATFDASDTNHAFTPFTGTSPQQLFNCLGKGDASPPNDLPDFDACQVRVASTNIAATQDQVFLTIALPGRGGTVATTNTDSSNLPYVLISGVVVLVVAGSAYFLIQRRRRDAT